MELYNRALRLQAEEKYEEAKVLLNQILEENIPLLEDNGGLPKSMQTIKFSCHINIGNIDLKLNKVSEALETFLLVRNEYLYYNFSYFKSSLAINIF